VRGKPPDPFVRLRWSKTVPEPPTIATPVAAGSTRPSARVGFGRYRRPMTASIDRGLPVAVLFGLGQGSVIIVYRVAARGLSTNHDDRAPGS
jgi:hypothetical protein